MSEASSEIYGLRDPKLDLVLPLYGGTMRGPLLLMGLPRVPEEAASKEYVDNREAIVPPPSDWANIPVDSTYFDLGEIGWQGCTFLGGYLVMLAGGVVVKQTLPRPCLITSEVPVALRPKWPIRITVIDRNEVPGQGYTVYMEIDATGNATLFPTTPNIANRRIELSALYPIIPPPPQI